MLVLVSNLTVSITKPPSSDDWNDCSCSGCSLSDSAMLQKCLANLIVNCESLIEFLISMYEYEKRNIY